MDEMQMRKDIKYAVDKSIEYAYRRGYSHGYAFGHANKDIDAFCEKAAILKWKEDLTEKTGAPGTPFRDHPMEWDSTIDDIKFDLI
jgi:hypothetical protein